MVKIVQPTGDTNSMIKRTIIAATIALMVMPTIAKAGSVSIRGAGSFSCGSWIKETDYRPLNMQWVLGFITALNYAESQRKPKDGETDLVDGTDANAIEVWMTNYCQANPLEDIWVAAGLLALSEHR